MIQNDRPSSLSSNCTSVVMSDAENRKNKVKSEAHFLSDADSTVSEVFQHYRISACVHRRRNRGAG